MDGPLSNPRGLRKFDAIGAVSTPRDSPPPLSEAAGPPNVKSNPAAALSRAGTLSWQQRPLSRGSPGARPRPLSMFSPSHTRTRSTQGNGDAPSPGAPPADNSLSRDQIAQSLGAKDPSWFRQTRDRGDGSAAYRKQQDGDRSETTASSERVRLQGLSRGPSGERPKDASPPTEGVRSISPSLDGSVRSKSSLGIRHSTSASLSSASGFRSPFATLQSQKFELPSSDSTSSQGGERPPGRRTLAMSPSQGRISPERLERSPSPTKGLGGFVQSAMLKRSDSVSKRWSAQAGSSLSRENSTVSIRKGYEDPRPVTGTVNPIRESKPDSRSHEGSPVATSRPGSSHSNVTLTQSGTDMDKWKSATANSGAKPEYDDHGFVKPALPSLRRSPDANNGHDAADEPFAENQMPASPSKKWSPTKASWLESAIKKPDLPKPKAPPPTQPNWMVGRTKAKQERENVDLEKNHNPKEVATVGLLRSPPPDSHPKHQTVPLLLKTNNADVLPESGVGNLESNDPVGNLNLKPIKLHEPDSQSGSPQLAPVTPTRDLSKKRTDAKPIHRDGLPSSSIATNHVTAEPRVASPATAEPVSQTPPKRDFRSNLKPRRASVGRDSKEEIEFKSVFGKLKRTQTQNYIAPDELKDNILRGKAGLASTGGPKKTEHKDEFKETLLKQREAIKAGHSPKVPPKPTGRRISNDRKSPVPEAIVKKEGLTRSKSGLDGGESKSGAERDKTVHIPENKVEKKQEKEKPSILPDKQPISRQRELAADGRLGESFTSSLAGLLSKGPSPLLGGVKPSTPIAPSLLANGNSTSITRGEPEPGGLPLIHMTKTRARGPKRRLPVIGNRSGPAEEEASSSSKPADIEPSETPAPIFDTENGSRTSSHVRDRSAPRALANISNNNNNRKPSQPLTPRKPSTDITLLEEMKPRSPASKPSTQDTSTEPATTSPSIKPKPAVPTGDGLAIKRSIPSNRLKDELTEKDLPGGQLLPKTSVEVPGQKGEDSPSKANPKPRGSVKVAAATWIKPLASDLAQPAGTNLVKPLRRKAEDKFLARANPEHEMKVEPIGLGIETRSEESQRTTPLDRNLPSPPMKSAHLSHSPKSPPLPGKKPASMLKRVSPVASPPQGASQSADLAHSSSAPVSNVLSSYVGEIPSSSANINIGTQTILASSSSNSDFNKIKTLRKQIWEITGHGKSIPVPSHQEHILFEDSLYLCTHVFGNLSGTRTTEVYLWCGSGVAESAADDAQIFARKVAKDNNGKLLILQQGKETLNFFQALGGIVITRRGSSSRGESPSKSSATYMLCGRRHLGQIAFDEVDYSAKSLCKAFPFLISARFGKLYLWKGAGSGADELGCARLIGMDLGLAGEIEEVDDGQEPDEFWESLPGGKHDGMTDFPHWHLRPVCEKYVTRLFGVEVESSRPKSSSSFTWIRRESAPQEENNQLVARVREITPFVQSDLARDGIYVLDVFFEIFV